MKLGLLLDLKAIFLQLADRKTKQVRFVELQCGAKMTEHIRQIAYRVFLRNAPHVLHRQQYHIMLHATQDNI